MLGACGTTPHVAGQMRTLPRELGLLRVADVVRSRQLVSTILPAEAPKGLIEL